MKNSSKKHKENKLVKLELVRNEPAEIISSENKSSVNKIAESKLKNNKSENFDLYAFTHQNNSDVIYCRASDHDLAGQYEFLAGDVLCVDTGCLQGEGKFLHVKNGVFSVAVGAGCLRLATLDGIRLVPKNDETVLGRIVGLLRTYPNDENKRRAK